MARLRIALVVPGAIALGAYEAGALAALGGLVRASRGAVVVDTIAGASAGAMTAVFLAHALLTGAGADDAEELWVRRASLKELLRSPRARSPRAPLAPDALLAWARTQLAVRGADAPQADGIYLALALANLRGLRYRVRPLPGGAPVDADTFRDYVARALGPDFTPWDDLIEAAAASGAHPLAFPPVKLRRKRAWYPPDVDFPGSEPAASMWFTDGGAVDNQPLGLALDAVFDPARLGLPERVFSPDERRVFLIVLPHPSDPPGEWPAGGAAPGFVATALRALAIERAQSAYDDLRRAAKFNTRVRFRAELERVLAGVGGAARDDVMAAGIRAAQDLDNARRAIGRPLRGLPADLAGAVEVLLDAATGTRGKQVAEIEVVSPLHGGGGDGDGAAGAAAKLAGAGWGHFLGLVSQDARRSDFALGYENFGAWWQSFRTGDHADLAPPARDFTGWPRMGGLRLRDVPGAEKYRLIARVVARYVRDLTARQK